MTAPLKVVVVGAGFGGLSAAAHLARAGARVTVVERAKTVGGKAGWSNVGGFQFDTGPTLLTMPEIVDEAFMAAGARVADVAPLARLDPVCRYVLPSGAAFAVSADVAATQASIAAVAPVFSADAAAWPGFLAECKEIWEAAGEPYLEAPFDGYFDFSQRVLRRGAKAVKLGMGLGTLDGLARRHFKTDAMRAFVGRFATYAGASPYEASAAFAMIPHLEINQGAFYPRGGMHALAAGLGAALERCGVVLHTGVSVREILLDGAGRAIGVATTDAALPRIDADVVVCDIDPLTVVGRLLPDRARRAAGFTALSRRTPSLSAFAWLVGVEGPVPTAAHHTVVFARDYADEFSAIFDRNMVAADPTVYVGIPTLDDPSRAPAGHHTIFTLINAPATGDAVDFDWDAESRRIRARLLEKLERTILPGLGGRIRAEAFVTPRDIARTGSAGGAIYGAAPHGTTAPFERPANRARGVAGLYYVGGATHPGGGVPLVIRGGRFVADLVVKDARKRAPSSVLRHVGGAP